MATGRDVDAWVGAAAGADRRGAAYCTKQVAGGLVPARGTSVLCSLSFVVHCGLRLLEGCSGPALRIADAVPVSKTAGDTPLREKEQDGKHREVF